MQGIQNHSNKASNASSPMHLEKYHTSCNVSWCGYKQNPTAYKHTDLPNCKDLHGEALKKVLTELFSEYSTDIVVNKKNQFAEE